VLDFGMDLKKSIDTPNFMGPILGGDQWDKEALPEGAFAENLVQAVVAKGQAIKLLSKMELLAQRGYWVAIQIDTKTGKRVGVAPLGANGCVAGY
jgi:hypothetical protein